MSVIPVRLFRGTFVSALGRVLGTIISIVTIGVMARALTSSLGSSQGVAAYGIYASALAFLSIVATFADSGLYLVFTREASRENADEKGIFEAVWFLRLVSIVVTIVVALTVAMTLPYSNAVRIGIFIGIWGIAFQLGSQLFMGVFQKRLRLLSPAVAEVAGRLCQLIAVLFFAKIGGQVNSFLFAFVLGTLINFCVVWLAAKKLVGFRLFSIPERKLIKVIFREALPMAISLVFSVIFFKVDSVLLSLLKPAQEVAYYTLAYKVLESLLFFPSMVGGMLLPIFSKANSKNAGTQNVLRRSCDLYLLGAIPLTIVLWVTAPLIVGVLGGPEFAPSISALRVLSLALAALFFGNLFGNVIVAIGQQRVLIIFYAFLIVLNVSLNLVFIPRYSFMGAAWITLITESISVLLAGFLLMRNKLSVTGSEKAAQILLSGLAMFLAVLLPFSVLERIAVGLLTYIALLFWMQVLNPGHIINTFKIFNSDAA